MQADAGWAMNSVGCQWRIAHPCLFRVDRGEDDPKEQCHSPLIRSESVRNQNRAELAAFPTWADCDCQVAASVDETGPAPAATVLSRRSAIFQDTEAISPEGFELAVDATAVMKAIEGSIGEGQKKSIRARLDMIDS